ncbi:ABC transporter substrate-binding protein [Cylindrospermopsis raciborskii]|uniref:ABC transporter substrate-binding protein n=1 Tax=Cylindrospermopsis raciborskii TaxID=77022 RepID=UPI001CA58772|nr:ABC transporter substrate-binding protein [Cylindrospermopsis raciborskii]
MFTTSLTATIGIGGCQQILPRKDNTQQPISAAKRDSTDNQPVKIGYLPITDAAPLLVAHSRKLYEAEGLTTEQPRLFRSWAQIVEAFLARQVNVIHVFSRGWEVHSPFLTSSETGT